MIANTNPNTVGEIKRCRPLLGTFVEITARGGSPEMLGDAITAAFSSVEKVMTLMSYHDPFSELSRVNGKAARAPVQVSEWTFRVFEQAQRLAAESGGAFDVTIAPRLASWGYLPRNPANSRAERLARWSDIELLPGRLVHFRRPLHMDLGGIAKGFAVDRAVDTLRAAGVREGLVNAGGDLRAFGDCEWPVQIRHPRDPLTNGHAFALRDSAVATSAAYFSRKRWRKCRVCPLVDGRTRLPCDDTLSVTVHAPDALFADALTKVVFALREASAPILQRHNASALLIDHAGQCAFIAAEKSAPVRA
jgi:thiamine biosynthesis lipoprotein